MRWLSRMGLACRGLVYVLVGYLAARIAVDAVSGARGPGQPADGTGALQEVAIQPFGRSALLVLAVGLAGYALSQLVEAVYRARNADTRLGKWSQRAISGFGALLYGAFCASTVSLALGVSAGRNSAAGHAQETSLSARLMGNGAGRIAMLALGLVLVASGVEFGRRAVRLDFRERFGSNELGPRLRRTVTVLGTVGCAARAAVFALTGAFVTEAAWTAKPGEARGLDSALRTLAEAPAGPYVLAAVAAGLVCYGAYCALEARYREM